MDTQELLMEIERKLWTNDAAYYGDTLTEDSLLILAETGVRGTQP